MPKRVAAVVTHPIQYQVPLFRWLSERPEIELTVFFEHDQNVGLGFDDGFGTRVDFGMPMLTGYRHILLSRGRGAQRTKFQLAQGMRQLAGQLRSSGFDWVWVHGYTDPCTVVALATAFACGMGTVLRGESTLLYETSPVRRLVKEPVLSNLVPRCTKLAYIGEQNRLFYARFGARPEQLEFSPYSVDNQYFAAAAQQARDSGRVAQIRDRYGIRGEDRVCLFVGKLVPRKRPMDVLRAAAKLGDDTFVLFVGEGELRSEIVDGMRQLGVRGAITGFVNQPELPQYYAASDVFVLPSEQETWGLVTNEAMACGLPAIVSDRAGCAVDLVGAGAEIHGLPIGGGSYRCGDTAALAAAVEAVLGALRVCPHEVRNAVRARVAQYDIPATGEGLLRAFMS